MNREVCKVFSFLRHFWFRFFIVNFLKWLIFWFKFFKFFKFGVFLCVLKKESPKKRNLLYYYEEIVQTKNKNIIFKEYHQRKVSPGFKEKEKFMKLLKGSQKYNHI